MGSIDWAGMPWFVTASLAFCTLFVLPIVLAIVGKRRSKPDELPALPQATPVEIGSPWFVQNFLQLQQDMQKMKEILSELKTTMATLSDHVGGLVALLKRRQTRKPPR